MTYEEKALIAESRRQRVLELKRKDPELSGRAIAERTGVRWRTVNEWLTEAGLNAKGDSL